MKGLFNILNCFSGDIYIYFGLYKYANVTFKSGRITEIQSTYISLDTKMMELEQDEAYMYTGISEVMEYSIFQ